MSFVTRLAGLGDDTARDAIVRNLTAIYNTQRGVGSVLPDFGLGEYYTYVADPELLRAELEDLASRYEPRLDAPRVALLGRDRRDHIQFVLSGRIAGQSDELRIQFDIRTRAVRVL